MPLLTTYHGAQMTGGLKVYELQTAMDSDFSVRKK
jgi:hypothetical protein